jgi:hypothetical protein
MIKTHGFSVGIPGAVAVAAALGLAALAVLDLLTRHHPLFLTGG